MRKLLIILSLFVIQVCHGQVYIQKGKQPTRRLYLGDKYDKQQIIKIFGNPIKYSKNYDSEAYSAYVEFFSYKGSNYTVIDGELSSFHTSDPLVSVIIKHIDLNLKVGMSVDSLLELSEDKGIISKYPQNIHIHIRCENGKDYTDGSLIIHYDSVNKITSIEWFYPI